MIEQAYMLERIAYILNKSLIGIQKLLQFIYFNSWNPYASLTIGLQAFRADSFELWGIKLQYTGNYAQTKPKTKFLAFTEVTRIY